LRGLFVPLAQVSL